MEVWERVMNMAIVSLRLRLVDMPTCAPNDMPTSRAWFYGHVGSTWFHAA